MPRLNRGIISRAASALIFCAAAAVLLVFPEGEAGGGRSSFAPAQVPPIGATTDEEFRSDDLCRRLGGNVRFEGAESVCNQVDRHGTFCIIGSADIFPCRGLLKQVILCNAEFNRQALNPFLCGIRCAPNEKARGANCEPVPNPDEVLPVRAITVFAAEGYAGPAHLVDVAAGFTLDFSETAAPGLTLAAVLPNDFEFTLTPLRATLAATLAALIRRAGYYPDALTLAAAFNPVFAPPPQLVSAIYDDPFALTLKLPANFSENATLTLASVSPSDAAENFQLVSTVITPSPELTLNAGGYAMNIEMTHPDFLGTLTMAATATIAQRGIFAEGLGLRGRFTVTVAFDHAGEVFHATISHPELNLEFARHDPDFFIGSYLAGLTVTLSPNRQTAVFSLTEPLASETGLPPRLGTPEAGLGFAYFYVRRQDRSPNYQELRLFVADYRVTTLNQPPVVDVAQTVAFSAGTVFFDFADSSYEGGVYAGATFTDASGGGANQLIARPDGKIEAGAGLTEFGNYAVTVEAVSPNAENFVGTARLTFRLNYEPPDLRIVPHDEVLAQREVTVYAAEGYEGPAHFVDVAAGYTLEFGERSGAGYTLAARGENDAQFVLNSPLRAPVNVALMPLISCSDCSSRPLTLSASFRPVAAPEQAELESVYDSEFTLTLALPQNYRQNFTVSIASVSPQSEARLFQNFQIVSNTLITRLSPEATPYAGGYTLNLEMTHPQFLGTLAIPITANIAQKIPSDEPDLELIGKISVTVAFGHTGGVISVTILNPNFEFGRYDFANLLEALPENNPYRIDVETHYLLGLTIALSPNRLIATLLMTAALEAGEMLPPVIGKDGDGNDIFGDSFALLYVQRRDGNPNYTDYGLVLHGYMVETLDPPPAVATLIRGSLAPQQVFHNFGASSYANGDYVGATFSESGGADASPALNVSPDGAVAAAPGLAQSGTYAITALAVSPDEQNFVGTARLTFTLTYEAPRAINPDDALPRRDVTVHAVAGYSGPAHPVNVADGFILNFSQTSGAGYTLAARAPNDFEFELDPLLSDVDSVLSADIECDNCLPASLTLSAAFRPVFPPPTQAVAAPYDSDFAVILQYPPGFDENANLSIAEISPSAAAENFAIVSNTITRASPELTPDAGEYDINIAMTHPNLLGTLTMTAAVSIAHGTSSQEGLELRGKFTVTVAFAHEGDVFHATIANPNPDITLEFGNYDLPAAGYLTGLTIALSPDRQTAAFSLTAPLADGAGLPPPAENEATFALLNVRRADLNPNYREQSISLNYRVTTLSEPPPIAILRGGQTPIAAGEQLFNFAAADYANGDYAGATFAEHGGQNASPDLNILANGAVAAAAELQTGTYDITALATHPQNFVGTARMTFTITYEAPRVPDPDEALPVRRVTVHAAAGYSGPAHPVNVEPGFTLNFSPRSGIGFTLAAREPNDFEFELLTLLAPIEQTFTAPVDCAFCLPSTLTLSAAFLPVVAPSQPPLRTTRGADVAHALVPPPNFPFIGANLSLQNSPGFSLINSTLQVDPFSPPAQLATAFVSMTDPGFLGTVTLSVPTRIFRLDAAGVSAFCESEPEGLNPGVLTDLRGETSELAGSQCVFSDSRTDCYGPDLEQDIANSAGITVPLCDDIYPDCASGTEDLDGNPLTNDCHDPANFVIVEFAASPSDLSGGTLIVSNASGATLFSGRRRLAGAQMTFVATPAGTHYVSLWAGAPSQCLAGDSSVPGEARECMIEAADGLDITVFFAEFFPQVRAVAELSPGAGGSASVEGLENGAKVSLGTTVTFVAAPDADSYVGGWSRAECSEVGDGANPGAEKECALTVSENLTVVATLFSIPQIHFSVMPLSGAGGTASIVGRASGARVPTGTTVTFVAAPNSNSYVSGWNRAECLDVGDGEQDKGVEKKCALTVNESLTVVATLLPPPSLQTIFYGNVYENAGDSETVPSSASPHLPVEVVARLEGTRRGLAMMRITVTVEGEDRDWTKDLIEAHNFSNIGAFCEGGGIGWRLPNFSEAAGLVSSANRQSLVETPAQTTHIPGLPYNMPLRGKGEIGVDFPQLANGDASAPSSVFGIIADLLASFNGEARPVYFPVPAGGAPQASVGVADDLTLICVRSFDESYSQPQNIAGIEVNGLTVNANSIISLTLRAAPQTPGGESYGTITLGAWRFADDGSRARANVDISHAADLADVEVVETGAGREILGLRPASGDFAVATIVAYPPVGRTITARVELTMDAARILFNGETIRQLNQDVNVIVPLAAPDESMSVRMSYHGTRRGVHILHSEAWWHIRDGFVQTFLAEGRFSGTDYGTEALAAKVCGRDGWRIPTVGEIVGASASGDNPLPVERVGGSPVNLNEAPAGGIVGLSIPMRPLGDNDAGPATERFYEADSRTASGNYVAVRYHSAGDVRFPRVMATRWIMCALDAEENLAPLSQLAAVRLESEGQIIGDPVASSANPSPAFNISVTVAPVAAGEVIFIGTVVAWKHKDNPTIIANARPEVVSTGGGTEFAASFQNAAGNNGTEIRINAVGAQSSALQTTLSLRAAHSLGVSAVIVFDIEVLPSGFAATYESQSTRSDTSDVIGELTATLRGGTPVAPGGNVDLGANVYAVATPRAGYYVHSWTGACVGAETADATQTGEPKTCAISNVRSALNFGAVFARDECAAASPCDPQNATCSDPDHLDFGTALECSCAPDFATTDNGRTCVSAIVTVVYEPAPTGGLVSAFFDIDGDARDGQLIPSGETISTLNGIGASVAATPDADHYLHSWTGACDKPDSQTGDAANLGAPQTCQLAPNELGELGARFGRDECATNNGGCDSIAPATCDDPNHLTDDGVQCACPSGHSTTDNGQTCLRPVPPADSVPTDERTAKVYVSPTYSGSVAFFRPRNSAVELQTPSAAPAGFEFPLNETFAAPSGITVAILAPLGNGGTLAGEWTATADGDRYVETQIPLRVEVSALAALSESWTGDAQTSGPLVTLSVPNFAGARFFSTITGVSLSVSQTGEVGAPSPLPDGEHLLSGWAEHDNFQGRLPFQVNAIAGQGGLFTVVFTAAPLGGAVSVYLDGGSRDGSAVNPGDVISTLQGVGLSVDAAPDPDHYLFRWTGACASSQTGSAANLGATQTCLIAANELNDFGAEFGRDECVTNNGGCSPLATCADSSHATESDAQCQCPAEYSTPDNGRTCIVSAENVDLESVIPAADRMPTVHVVPAYLGSVAFFRSALPGVTLQTPASTPAGFSFPTDAGFVGPDSGVTVELSLPLETGGVIRRGEFVLTVRLSSPDFPDPQITIGVIVSAIAPIAESWRGETGASGALLTLSVPGFPNARFSSTMTGASLAVSQGGVISAPAALAAGEHSLSGWAEHDDFIGRLPFQARANAGFCERPADAQTSPLLQREFSVLMDALAFAHENGNDYIGEVAKDGACGFIVAGADPTPELARNAVIAGREEVLEFLAGLKDSDINAYNNAPWGTPLDLAIRTGNDENARALRRAGAGCAAVETSDKCAPDHPDYAGLPPVDADALILPAGRNLTVTTGRQQSGFPARGWPEVSIIAENAALHVRASHNVGTFLTRPGRAVQMGYYYPHVGQTESGHITLQVAQKGKRPGAVRIDFTYESLAHIYLHVDDNSPGDDFYDLRTDSGEAALANATLFIPGADNPPEFEISKDGLVSGPETFSDSATLYFFAHSDDYVGIAVGRLDINPPAARPLQPDEVLRNRNLSVTVLVGHTGPVHNFAFRAAAYRGYFVDLDSAPTVFANGGATRVDGEIRIPAERPMAAGEERRVEMTLDVSCRFCGADDKITVAANLIPLQVTLQPQPAIRVTARSVYERGFNLPEGFGSNDGVVNIPAGRPEAAYFNVRGSVIYSQGRLEDYLAPAGTYVFPVHFRSHFRGPSFVGTVTLTLTLENIGIPLATLGIPQSRLSAAVNMARGFAGTVYAVAPADERVRSNCAFAQVYGGLLMNAACELIRPPGASGGHNASVVITETLDPYHETRLATLRLSVRELPAPLAAAAAQILYQSDSAHDFSSFGYAAGAYADAEFSHAGESPHLGVEPDGRVFTRGVLYAGNYGITVLARSPDFLGAAALTFSLAVLDPANPGIPAGLLNASVYVAAGYLGEIHRLTPALDSTQVSCDPADGTANIAVSAECVLSLTGGSGARSVELDATQTPSGRAAETARATVVAREIPPPEEFTALIVEGTPFHRGEEDLFNLAEWAVDGQTFAARFPRAQFAVAADDANAFSVSPDGRARMSAAHPLGSYRATIHAFSGHREFRGTVAFDVAVTVGRLVLSEDSVPTDERFFIANIVPGYRGTLWSGTPENSEVALTLIRRAVAGAQRYFYNPVAVVDDCGRLLATDEGGNLRGTIPPKDEQGTPADCVSPGDVHDPISDALNVALNNGLRYDAGQGAVLLRATCGETCLRTLDFRFNVRASRPGLWAASGFQVGIRAALLSAKDETPRNAAHNAADAAGKVLMTFNLSTGLSAAQFAEASDSANLFTVSQNGEVRLSGASAPPVGIYEITVMATAPPDSRGVRMFYGTVQASAKIRFVSAGGIAFAGAVFSDDGDKTTVNLSDDLGAFSDFRSDAPSDGAPGNLIETPYLYSPVYRGIRRGLHWVESEDALENKTLHRDQRGLPERLCQAGGTHNGKKWRLPTLSEVAGILSDGTGNVVLAENNHDWLIPGAAPGMAIPLPSVARGGGKNLTGDAFVVSPLDRTKGGKLAPVSYELDGTTAKLNGFVLDTVTCPGDSSVGAPPGHRFVGVGSSRERVELCPLLGAEPRMACVLETDSFSATPPLLAVRLSGGGISAGGDPSEPAPKTPAAAQRALAGVLSQTGAFLTMTASAWRYFAQPQTRVAARDVRATLTRSIAGAGFAADFSDLANGVRAVVRLTETPEFDLQNRAFTLSFAPEFGATLRMQITARVQAPPVTREQEEEALPPAERDRALRVAVGHSGDLLTITSHASPYNVLLPQGSVGDGLGLRSISGGAVLTVSEISLALDSRAASFTVTVSVTGLNQRGTLSLSYSIDPLQAPIMEPIRLASEDAGGATVVDLKEGEFAAATFARVSGDPGLSVKAATGEVIAEERVWTDGGYNIVVGASDANAYIGQVQFTVSLIVGVIPPVVFTYNHQQVRGVGDIVRVDDVYDENSANRREFSMTYRGARRGLHWMETTESASASHQRGLCRAGERGGRDVWRVPTPAEIAGLLLTGETAEIGAATPAENGAYVGAILSLAARVPADETLSGLSEGPFFADFLLNGSAALAEEDGGKLNLSGEGGEGRYLCVLEMEDDYQIPPRIAGIRMENGGDAQYNAAAFSFRHGRTAVGEQFRVSLFAYHSPLSGGADAAAASLQVEIVERGSYVASVIADPQTPGLAQAVLETPGALAEATITASFRASPPLGATVAFSITLIAFSDGGRPVLPEDSIPVGERFVQAYIVPGFDGTLWSGAAPANADAELTLIQRAIAGAQRYFYDPLAVVDDCGRLLTADDNGNLKGTIPTDSSNMPVDCVNPGDVHDPNSDAVNVALNSALRYDAAQNAVLLRSTCGTLCISNLDFRFNVHATRPGLAWDPALFAVGFRANDMPEANPINIALDADDAPGRVLLSFAVPAGFGAEFSEESDSADLFTVARNGEVRLSGSSAPAAGTYHITVIATASANARGVRGFYGTVRTSAQIRLTDDSLAFAGVGIASAGDETGDVNVANDFGDLSDYQCPTNNAGRCITGQPYVEIPYVYNAVYQGIRRGLHWVETKEAIENGEFYDSQRGLPQRLCAAGGESGGKQWRLPTLSELAGILSDGTGAIALTEVNRDYEIPGAAVGMSLPLPSVVRGGAKNLTGDAFVVSPLDRNRTGRIAPTMYEFTGGQAKLHGHRRDTSFNCLTLNNITACAPPGFEYVEEGDRGCEGTACLFPRPPLGPDARIACVLETDSAVATPQLLGARVEANGRVLAGGAVALTATAPTTPSVANVRLPGVLTAAGPIITVNAVGWNFRDNNARVAVRDHPGATMSVSVNAPQGFSVQIENSGRAVVHADEAPDLYAEANISIAAWPPFGATVSVVMRFATGEPDEAGPPVSDAQLAALLPPAQRNVSVLVPAQNSDLDPALAPGFTGEVHRLVPGAAGTLLFAPAADAGMTLLANGVVSIAAAPDAEDGPQTAVFSVTAKIEGRRRTPFLISVTAEPISVETIQREVLTAESAGVLFDLPALSTLLADATEFRVAAGAFLRVNNAGMITSDPVGGLSPRDAPYEITVGARSPAHLGELFFRVRLRVSHPPFSESEREAAIPAAARSVFRAAASGYSGALKLTLFSRDSQTELDFPSPAPTGFSVDSAGRVSLAGAFTGERIEGVFQITARRSGRENAVIPVEIAVGPPQTPTLAVARFDPQTSGELNDFGAGDLSGAVFSRDASSDSELALSAEGVLSAPNPLAEGTYRMSGNASGGLLLGVIYISAVISVEALPPPVFAGTSLTAIGVAGFPRQYASCTAGGSCRNRLYNDDDHNGEGMVYHGLRRGLHWVVNTQKVPVGSNPANLWPPNSAQYYTGGLCPAGGTHDGRAWRLPTLSELAGAYVDSNAAGFLTLSTVWFQSRIPGAAAGVRIPYRAGSGADAGILPLADGALQYYSEVMEFGIGSAGVDSYGSRVPSLIWTGEGEARLSSSSRSVANGQIGIERGGLACVLETEGYESPRSLLGIRVRSGGAVLLGETATEANSAPEREARVSAPAVSSAGAVYTLTVTGWRYGRSDPPPSTFTDVNVIDEELPDALLTTELAGDTVGASHETRSVSGEGTEVILRLDSVPTSDRTLQLNIWPQVGLTVSIFVTVGP